MTTPPPIVLRSSIFRKGREASWQELERLVATIERRGPRALGADDLQRLPLLYRSTLSSLSVARSIALDRHLLLYLEALALRAFLAVYGPRASLLAKAIDFLGRGFPAAVRAARWHILIAAVALLVGAVAGFWLTLGEEAWFSSIVPRGLAGGRGPSSTRADFLEKEIFAPFPGVANAFVASVNWLFANNAAIGILLVCLGIAAGVPTVLLLVYNGLVLGSFVALHTNRGLTVEILGWMSIHGVTEITSIVLSGAAGLMIAEKILFPDRRTRLDSLAHHGRQAAKVAVGAFLMLIIAAILEGGFRQLIASTEGRFFVAAVSALLWLGYFTGWRPRRFWRRAAR